MISAKPGYWDLDRCSWIGVDPSSLTSPVRHADHAHVRDVASPEAGAPSVPEPRTEDESSPAVTT
jgi:hypothetical protein